MEKVTVRVPATSANIGPAFDCAGIAFSLYNVFSFEKLECGVKFENFEDQYTGKDNLAYVAYKAACDAIGVKSDVKITSVDINVPFARGLGSSATLVCAGVVAANLLNGKKLTDNELLEIANSIEGHPDNVDPALFGGLCASVICDGKPFTVKFNVSDKIYFTALIPNFEVKTSDARVALPGSYCRKDVIFNMSRTALLPYAFEKGDFELIKTVTQDKIHEQYRKRLFKNIDEVEKIAYSMGAVTFFISGAGSTCMCISSKPIYNELNKKLKNIENEWIAYPLEVDNQGTKEV